MNFEQITSRKEYDEVMSKIESLLQKATELGGGVKTCLKQIELTYLNCLFLQSSMKTVFH